MELFDILSISTTSLSMLFSLILLFQLNKKQSNYADLMRHIVISENIFIFAQMMIVTAESQEQVFQMLSNIFYHITFGIAQLSPAYFIVANSSIYYGHEAYSIFLNIFICLEIILILKNPIVQVKNRLKLYYLVATIAGLMVFFLAAFTIPDSSHEYALINIFYAHISISINLGIYLLFVLVGLISIFYLIYRFCVGKTLLQNLRNAFVIRHCIYVAVYLLCLLPNKINVMLTLLGYSPSFYLKLSILLNLCMGFIMFLIRASETNFYTRLFCRYYTNNNNNMNQSQDKSRPSESQDDSNFFDRDIPLTAIISRNMNLEFMCCILYGLREIFMKPERKNKLSDISQTDGMITFNIQNSQSQDRSLLNLKNITSKDFKRAKSHRIRYKKIFKDNIDFQEMEVEVSTYEKKKYMETHDSSFINDLPPTNEKENKDHDAMVVEYCPRVFRELRRLDEITGYDLERSLNPILNLENINKITESEGKSGSFFFFSHDNRFLIKTISNNELNTILGHFMQSYYEHCSTSPESLLARIYGLYSIVIGDVSKINLILMQNLNCVPTNHLKRVFDLKGSRVERITKKIEKCDKRKTLKDLDYLWMIDIEEDMIDFPKDHCEELTSVLQADLTMLREVGVMDYSLLLIILHFPKSDDPDYQNIFNLFGDARYCRRIFKSKNMKYVYIMGIIDYLQKFNAAKFFENKYKSILYGNEIKYVSAVDPMIYSDRLFNFAKDYIFITQSS